MILDLRKGSYLAFDEVGTSIWRFLLQERDPQSFAAHLSRRYQAAPGQIQTEIDTFLRRCLEQGLLVSPAAPDVSDFEAPSASRWGRLPFVSAWLSLFKTSRLLTKRGFGSCYAAASALSKPASSKFAKAGLDSAIRTFLKAETFFWLKGAPNDCLARSMALYRFLLSMGIPATHRIGVRQAPFFAHAWVEFRRTPLLETKEVTSQFCTIAEL